MIFGGSSFYRLYHSVAFADALEAKSQDGLLCCDFRWRIFHCIALLFSADNTTFVRAITSQNPVISDSAAYLVGRCPGGWLAVNQSESMSVRVAGRKYYMSTVKLPVGQGYMVSPADVLYCLIFVASYEHSYHR